LGNFVEHFWDQEGNAFKLDLDDEILSGCVLTHEGKIVHERFLKENGEE
jgi:NAD(P) transhydrogenase subunit alpha